MATFNDLPDEVKVIILKTNNLKELLKFREINSQFKNLCQSNLLWKDFVINKFGDVIKINNSWFETYKYFLIPSKAYLVTYKQRESSIVGIYKCFDSALLSIINNIIEMPPNAGEAFYDYFIDKYPEFIGIRTTINFHLNMPKNIYDSFIEKFNVEIDNYVKKYLIEVTKDNFIYHTWSNQLFHYEIKLVEIRP